MTRKESVSFAISGVMLFTLIGKVLGFVKELILAHYFGAGAISDAYLISQTIPGTLFQMVGVGISTCFVPVYLKVKNSGDDLQKKEFINKFITLVLLVSLSMIILVIINTEVIVRIFAMGFDKSTLKLAIDFTRISVLSLGFSGLVYSYNALLQSEKKFIPVAFGVIPYNLGLILAIFIGAKVHLYAISYISCLAVCFQLIYLIEHTRKIPYKFSFNFHFKDKYLRKSLVSLPPIIVGTAATEINTLVDRTLASSILVGGITIFTYSTSLFNLVIGLFSQSISNVFYPLIAESVINKNKKKLEEVIVKATNLTLLFLIPTTLGMIAFSTNIVHILFGHGSMSFDTIKDISSCLCFYSIGFVFYSIKLIYNNVFYANNNTKVPMINTIIGIIINIIFNITLSRFIGLNGLALATSISSCIIALFMYKSVKTKYKINILPPYKVIIKYFISALIMFIICSILLTYLKFNVIVTTLMSFVVGVIIYFCCLELFGINFIDLLKK